LSHNDFILIYGGHLEFKNFKTIKIPSCGLLNETGVRALDLEVFTDQNRIPYFFECSTSKNEDYSFDLLSMIFFLLSRYEEYLNSEYDIFGRFCAKNSMACQFHFLETPVVDIWIKDLLNKIVDNKKGEIKTSAFKIIPTIDIDQVWAFKFKGIKNLGGILKDLVLWRPQLIIKRIAVLLLNVKDPFQTFEKLESLLKKYNKSSLFFILYSKNPSRLDINHQRENKVFTDFLRNLSKKFSLGIHPSIQSGKNDVILEEEAFALSQLLKKEIRASRFHYISFQLPESYQALLKAGVTQDYSMGYPEQIGFRASTGNRFFWYDLTNEKTTSLEVYPFQIMDVTLKKYLGMNARDAKSYLQKQIGIWKNQTDCVHFIWHNSSFAEEYGWKDWEVVFEWLLAADHLQNEDLTG